VWVRFLLAFTGPLLAIASSADVVIDASSEIVLATNAPYAARLAAEELNFFLKRALGSALPVVAERTSGRTAIVLGDVDAVVPTASEKESPASSQARLRQAHPRVESRPRLQKRPQTVAHRDGFVIEATNGVVRIFGNDDDVPGGDVSKTCGYGGEAPWQPHFRRGTLFGVYEFLERYAGVRMYFPGELGTVVPSAERTVVSDGRHEKVPVFRYRRYGYRDGPQEEAFKRLNWYRLRMETETMKCVHGHRRLRLYERFGKTHPEYFANHHNKHVREQVRKRGHLCHSSKVWEEIERDAMKYFADGGTDTFDLMPEDGMTPVFRCNCPACVAAYGKDRQYATDLVWRRTAEVAAHVMAKFPDARFTQMAYHPYGDIPGFALPDNIDVTVARKGPWGLAFPTLDRAESDEVRAWAAKLGRKVMLWNYSGKWNGSVVRLPGVPQLAPRAWAAYYKSLADVINGAFAESESDRWSYNYLNYYVFSRVCWDPEVDVERILAEHHRLMFGPAAKPMAKFYDLLEQKWMEAVAAGYAEILMNVGLTTKHDATEASRKIFTQAVIGELEALLNDAARAIFQRNSAGFECERDAG